MAGLKDMNQLITYQYEADSMDRQWYSCLLYTSCNYEMVLYDEEGNQVGIGKDNGNGGLSITIPNWNTDNRGYTCLLYTSRCV